MEVQAPTSLPYIDYESIFKSLYQYLNGTDYEAWKESFLAFLVYYKAGATLVVFLCALGIFYASVKLMDIRHKESLIYNAQLPQVYEMPKADAAINKKWEKILLHIESENSNDWKIAIIEADILLDEMLSTLGYLGDSVGEKLKRVVKGDLTTLDQAWEAHKVRNAIAHQGADFVMNQREAKHVVSMYQAVLDEFQAKTQSGQ